MVTFSNNPGGKGYSRCFVADKEDLEFAELPMELDHRISSYRVFKWHNFQKKVSPAMQVKKSSTPSK